MFSNILSVKNEYLMNDLFQILPLEKEEREKYKSFMNLYPFRLKVKYDNSPDEFVRIGRRILEMDTGKFNDFNPFSSQDNNNYHRTN